MKWSWKIGRIAGIDLKIHLTFFFLLLWAGFSTLFSGGAAMDVFVEVLFILALFLCVVLHELGHALTARRFGIATRDITLLPIGGVARLDSMPEKPKNEFLVAAAGPAVNVLISILLFVGLIVSGALSQTMNLSVLLDNFWLRLLTVNVSLVAFNLIPAFPMDGGRVLRAILASHFDYVKATRIAVNIGRGFAVLMGIAGLFFNPWLILTALFIWSGAGAEGEAVEVKAGVKGLVVRDVMISQFYQIEANQTLESVFQLSLATGQQHIPVVSNGNFLGIIRRSDLMIALEKSGNQAPAYTAIGFEPQGLDPESPVQDVLSKFAASRVQPVIENSQLIGLVTPESVQQRMWLNKRKKQVGSQPPGETVNPT
ncbi:MAG: site-2 protease family protein [Chloroflexota bacterium]|nr:site-2 protease family protein [Chloroflexota bacterium]